MNTGNLFKNIYGYVKELGSLQLDQINCRSKIRRYISASTLPLTAPAIFFAAGVFAEKFNKRVSAKLSIIKFQSVERENSSGLKKLLILNLNLYSVRRELY
ncbi:MAG: hypothetical protein M3R14_10530 [Acidobacteriota bacterium]|nr:hypothetical protein [Acidobacteriota bacterium]